MKNDIRIIKNELVGTSNNKILKQEKEIFFNELNDILKYALINEVQKRLKTEDKYSIFKDRFNIYYNLVTYELLKPLYIKYQKNNDFSSLEDKSFSRFKIPVNEKTGKEVISF